MSKIVGQAEDSTIILLHSLFSQGTKMWRYPASFYQHLTLYHQTLILLQLKNDVNEVFVASFVNQ